MFALPNRLFYEVIIVPAESVQMFMPEILPLLLAELHGALKLGGLLVLDLATFDPSQCDDPEAPRYFRPSCSLGNSWTQWRRQAPDGNWVTRQVAHADNVTHINFKFIYTIESSTRSAFTRETRISLWRYQPEHLIELAKKAGFECERLESSYTNSNTSQGPRLIISLIKAQL
jgi:hypothetical protein